MKPFDYLLLLAAILLGLALTDLAISVQRLLNASRRVRWDWLAPLAAVLAFLKIMTQWWAWFSGEDIASGITFIMFAGFLVSAGLLFLLAATSLPDHADASSIDLGDHYASVRRRYWLLFASHFFLSNAMAIWTQSQFSELHYVFTPALLILPLALALAFVRSRFVHGFALVCFILFYVQQEFGRSLGH